MGSPQYVIKSELLLIPVGGFVGWENLILEKCLKMGVLAKKKNIFPPNVVKKMRFGVIIIVKIGSF